MTEDRLAEIETAWIALKGHFDWVGHKWDVPKLDEDIRYLINRVKELEATHCGQCCMEYGMNTKCEGPHD